MYASDPVFYAYYAARAHTRMSEGAKGEGVGKDSLPSKGQARDEAAATLIEAGPHLVHRVALRGPGFAYVRNSCFVIQWGQGRMVDDGRADCC